MVLLAIVFSLGISPAPAAGETTLKTFQSKTYGFALDYPPGLVVKESKGKKDGALWSVSFYADPADADPCFWIEARPLDSVKVYIKPTGNYAYDPTKKEWRIEPGYDEESRGRLSVSYMTPAKIPVYSGGTWMSNFYEDDAILTDKDFALMLHYSDATKMSGAREFNATLASSLRLIGTRAIEARIVDPPPPRDD